MLVRFVVVFFSFSSSRDFINECKEMNEGQTLNDKETEVNERKEEKKKRHRLQQK